MHTEIGPSSTSYYTHSSKFQYKQRNHNQQAQCRICLQQMLNQAELEYCLCKGNLKYVHQECLLQWTQHTKIFEQGRIKYCFCQICKGRILLQTQTKLSFASRVQILSSIFCNPLISQRIKRIVLVIVFFLLLSVEIIFIFIYLSDPNRNTRATSVLVALIALNSLFLLLGALYLLFKYLLTKTTRVVAVKGLAFNWKNLQNKSKQVL